MKKAFLMALACLLLTGCGGAGEPPESATPEAIPQDTADTLPEPAPAEPISAPAVVTEGQAPEELYDLPTEIVSLYDWQTSGEPLALLAEIPEQEMALYGVADGDTPYVLFRWGDTLAEFPNWVIDTPKSVTPELLALDLDGDGAAEPVVACFQGGNQVSRYALHVLQQSSDTLTDCQLPESLYEEQLSALLTLSGSGETLTISLGSQSIEATLPEGVQAETLEHLWTGAFVSWSEAGGVLWLEDRPALYPEDSALASVVSLAVLSAQVSLSDGQFTLSDMTLQSKLS